MKATRTVLAVFLAFAAAGAAHAQLYKWIGPDGKVTYSDSPPPAMAKKVETKAIAASGPSTAGLPFELAEAVRNSPVTLYTSQKCLPCDEGRAFLNSRGIPFTEKTVNSNDDALKLRDASGSTQLPFLLVGRTKQSGWTSEAWGASLTAAGYPEANRLPKTYRNPAPEAAAPQPKPEEKKTASAAPAAQRPAEDVPAAAGNAPPGFRF